MIEITKDELYDDKFYLSLDGCEATVLDEGDFLFILDLETVKEKRGVGLARKVVEYIKKIAEKNDKYVELEVCTFGGDKVDEERLINFYKTLGFFKIEGRLMRYEKVRKKTKNKKTIDVLKGKIELFSKTISKKEMQIRAANTRKIGCSVEDMEKFYTESKNPSKQAKVYKGERLSLKEKRVLYDINTWLEKIKTDGQEKALQEFVDFVQREQPLLREYEEVFKNGETPCTDIDKEKWLEDGLEEGEEDEYWEAGGKLIEILETSDGYKWEVWEVSSYAASRYLAGTFGDDGELSEVDKNFMVGFESKQISYKRAGTKWCIAYGGTDYHWEDRASKANFIFLIRQDGGEDNFRKIALEIFSEEVVFWDAEDKEDTFLNYECFGELVDKLDEANIVDKEFIISMSLEDLYKDEEKFDKFVEANSELYTKYQNKEEEKAIEQILEDFRRERTSEVDSFGYNYEDETFQLDFYNIVQYLKDSMLFYEEGDYGLVGDEKLTANIFCSKYGDFEIVWNKMEQEEYPLVDFDEIEQEIKNNILPMVELEVDIDKGDFLYQLSREYGDFKINRDFEIIEK